MPALVLFNKPYGVLSQFTDSDGRPTLRDYIPHKNIYPAGRLDMDSEGLLLLTDDGKLQHQISEPVANTEKTYWAQVEGEISEHALEQLRNGLTLKDGPTLPAKARQIAEPELWPRDPPIRHRQHIPTSWIELSISEGRNRQVRRMTAAVSFPTLRLVRIRIGKWDISGINPGSYEKIELNSQMD